MIAGEIILAISETYQSLPVSCMPDLVVPQIRSSTTLSCHTHAGERDLKPDLTCQAAISSPAVSSVSAC